MLTHLANSAIRVLLAPGCAACDVVLEQPLAGPVCPACWLAVAKLSPPVCGICGDVCAVGDGREPRCARCVRQPPVFQVARSAGVYEGSLREIIHAFKYDNRRALAKTLGGLMRDAGRDLLDDADAVVPVPLHPWRRLRRGFNQADDLARQLGRPVQHLLRRRRYSRPQAGLKAAGRRGNVSGAYALRRLVPATLVRDRVLVVVDDVMTTGATIDACSRVLLDAGARSVRALTVGRAVAGRPVLPPLTLDPSTARHR